jgi:lactate permease
LLKDLAPFLFIFVSLASVNLFPLLRYLCRDEWIFALRLIPGHSINLRPLYDAYLYLFLAYRLHATDEEKIVTFFRTGSRKAMGAVAAIALFGAMGEIISYTGYSKGFTHLIPGNNIAICLASGLIGCTGKFYPVLAPFLGWIGTFLTGYGMASVMLFGKLQLQAAQIMGISPSLLASALTVGASIGSVSSPFKIALAAPLCGAEGREGEILAKTIPLGLAVSFATGVFTLFTGWMR